nr:SHOCT domain-containing protein [Rhizobium skierniewicense]
MAPPSASAAPEQIAFHQDDIISKIERLAGLRSKGIISDDEFAAKKTELLDRL